MRKFLFLFGLIALLSSCAFAYDVGDRPEGSKTEYCQLVPSAHFDHVFTLTEPASVYLVTTHELSPAYTRQTELSARLCRQDHSYTLPITSVKGPGSYTNFQPAIRLIPKRC